MAGQRPIAQSVAAGPSDRPLLSPGLYLIATPIGNLGDITLRAIETLAGCEAVACEDTRVAGKLMKHLGLSKPLWRQDDHASAESRSALLEKCRSNAIALVSDAGTPLVSDPGYRLVSEALEQGVAVHGIPGPCAAIAALVVSGLPTDRFLFAGFLPVKDKARSDTLRELGGIKATLVFYETAPRLARSLAAIADIWPERICAVARELTKMYEESRRGTAAALLQHYTQQPPKGEIVLLVGPADETPLQRSDAEALLRDALAQNGPSQAAAEVARMTGGDRKALYEMAIRIARQ